MNITPLARAVTAAMLSLAGASALGATAQEATLEELAPYTDHRRDVVIAGQTFSFLKLNYGKTAEQVVVDAGGQLREPREILKLNRASFYKYGNIHPHLYNAMGDSSQVLFDVLLWIKIDTEPIARILRPTQVERGAEQKYDAALTDQYDKALPQVVKQRESVLSKLGISKWVDEGMEGTPFVRVELSRGEIEEFAKSSLVKMLMLREDKGREDLADSIAIANADVVHADGITGTGVKVAIFESAPADDSNLDIEDAYSDAIGVVPSSSDHAQLVTAVIKNLTAVSGFAPDALTYSADSKDLAAFDWAVDQVRVSVLNQSFHRGAEINDGLSTDDLYKDYKVLHYPWPTIVHAAGNWCGVGGSCYESGNDVTDEYVNHKGFNTISIGNHNDDATAMRLSSVFVNPSSAHGDRELPELCANGTGVSADGLFKGGTSFASPAVAGSVALLQDNVSTLRYWPEANRALLFAGAATNVPSHNGQLSGGGDAADAPNYWWDDVIGDNDGFDGAGALNTQRSVAIAEHRWNGTAESRGWDIGVMRDGDFNRVNHYERSWHIQPQSDLPVLFRPHVRVALAWNSNATVDDSDAEAIYASELAMDLDVQVFDSDGVRVAHSMSWDNSYEIVDFDGKAGETYTIKVHRWTGDANDWTWFGIAWDTSWSEIPELPLIVKDPIPNPVAINR